MAVHPPRGQWSGVGSLPDVPRHTLFLHALRRRRHRELNVYVRRITEYIYLYYGALRRMYGAFRAH